nr:hypothetical protein [Novosphingobium jiangmenense]
MPDQDFSTAFDPGVIGILAGSVDLAEGYDSKNGEGLAAQQPAKYNSAGQAPAGAGQVLACPIDLADKAKCLLPRSYTQASRLRRKGASWLDHLAHRVAPPGKWDEADKETRHDDVRHGA